MPDDSIDMNIGASLSGSPQSFADPSAVPTPMPAGNLSAEQMMSENAAAATAANTASQSARMTADQELGAAYMSRGGVTLTTPGTPFSGDRYTGPAFATGPQTRLGGMANPAAFSSPPTLGGAGAYDQLREAEAQAKFYTAETYAGSGRGGLIGSATFNAEVQDSLVSQGWIEGAPSVGAASMSPFREAFSRGGQGWTGAGLVGMQLLSSSASAYAQQTRGVYMTPEQQEQSNLGVLPAILGGVGLVAGGAIGGPGGALGGAALGAGVGSGIQTVVGAGLEREQSGRISGQEFASATGASVEQIRKFTDAIMQAGVATQQVASLMSTLTGSGPGTTGATASYAIGLSSSLGTLAPQSNDAVQSILGRSPITMSALIRSHTKQGDDFYSDVGVIGAEQGDYRGSVNARLQVDPNRAKDISTVNAYQEENKHWWGDIKHGAEMMWNGGIVGLWSNNPPPSSSDLAYNAAIRLHRPENTASAIARQRADAVTAGVTDIATSEQMGGIDVSRAQIALGTQIYRGASAVDIGRESGTFRRAIEGEITGIARGRAELAADRPNIHDPAARAFNEYLTGQADVQINQLRQQETQFGAELTLSRYAQREGNIGVAIAGAAAGVTSAQLNSTPGDVSSAQGTEINRLRDLQSQLNEEIRKGIPIYEDEIRVKKELAVTSQQITTATAQQRQEFFASTGANIGASLQSGLTSGSLSAITGGNVGGSAYSAQDTTDMLAGVQNAEAALSRAPVGSREWYNARLRVSEAKRTEVDATAQVYGYNPRGRDVIAMENASGDFAVSMQAPFMSGPGSNPLTAYRGMYQALQPLIAGAQQSVATDQNMLNTGRDSHGNPLTAEQREGITQALSRDTATYQQYRLQEAQMQHEVLTNYASMLPESSVGAPAGMSVRSIGLSALSSRFLGNTMGAGTWGHNGMTMNSLIAPHSMDPNTGPGGTSGGFASIAHGAVDGARSTVAAYFFWRSQQWQKPSSKRRRSIRTPWARTTSFGP